MKRVSYTGDPVEGGPELARILSLERHDWHEGIEELTDLLTDHLKKPAGRMRLHPWQAAALRELWETKRLLFVASVGAGKTIVSALAPTIVNARKPMWVTYARLVAKTRTEFAELSKHWKLYPIPAMNIISAERFVDRRRGDIDYLDPLDSYEPDIIVIDEVQAFSRYEAARVKRLRKYIKDHPDVPVVGLTGTPGDKEIKRIANLFDLCLRDLSPYPRDYIEKKAWGDALDAKVVGRRREPGVLEQFASGSGLEAVRAGIGEYVERTRGVVYHRDASVDASLYLEAIPAQWPDPDVDKAFDSAIKKNEMPDGREFEEPVYKHLILRQLGLGFAKVLDPNPPKDWKDARRLWGAFCADFLSSPGCPVESPFQVQRMIERGELDDSGILAAWREIEGAFTPRHVLTWISLKAVEYCATWLKREKGLVWTPFPVFGEKLSRVSGIPYFGRLGLDKNEKSIEDHKGPAILSIEANKTGRNLQRYSTNLIVAPPSGSDDLNQLIGRTHRQGSEADEVSAQFLLTCRENYDALVQARNRAVFDTELNRDRSNKLLVGDWIFPDPLEVVRWTGPRWVR